MKENLKVIQTWKKEFNWIIDIQLIFFSQKFKNISYL